MARVVVDIVIPASRDVVWEHLRDIASHVEWMADADAIRFTSPTTEGLGTTFDCDTRIGRIRLTDRMQVTEWEPCRSLGVDHVGVVAGRGRFLLDDTDADASTATRLTWEEELRFPLWLGAAVGARLARPVLRRVWAGNLRRFRARVQGPSGPLSGPGRRGEPAR